MMRGLAALAFAGLVGMPGDAPQQTIPPPGPLPDAAAVERGASLYTIYCRACHGAEGRGDGPAAAALDRRPEDLTALARANGGEFPTARAITIIDGRTRIPGHENGRMPIFGLSLQEQGSDANQEPQVREKIQDLVGYLRSIQRPAAP